MNFNGNNLVLGYRPDGRPIILDALHRLQHTSIVGQTGSGKSYYNEWLIRQDIRACPKSRCGMLVIDPHGEMFDNIMAWVAANRLNHLPIVPIDLRRKDRILSYNPLRQRTAEPAVIIDNFVKVMAHVWGAATTDQTPLFERWATNSLHRLYSEKRTLADAGSLFTPDGCVAVDRIDDPSIRRDWVEAARNWKNFERDTLSAVNRFRRFLLNPLMRAMFGQSDVSLDVGQALDEGQIIVVSLGRTRGTVSQENGDLLATLLLSDFWMAAEERDESERHRPFYLYIDEFQRYITPAMAESLAEARGFGIGMTLSNQFPRQVYNAGPHGPRIYDEVRANVRTKIAFRQRSRENMEIVANELFFGTFNPMAVKYQHRSTKVLGHGVKYMLSTGHSITTTAGGGDGRSKTVGASLSLGASRGHTRTLGRSLSHSTTDATSHSISETENWSTSSGDTKSSVRSGTSASGVSDSSGTTMSEMVSENLGLSGGNVLAEDGSAFADHVNAGVASQSWNIGSSVGVATSESSGSFETESSGWNEAESHNSNTTHGGGITETVTTSHAETETESVSLSKADSRGVNVAVGASEADTAAENKSWSSAKGRSYMLSPMLMPKMGKEADAPVFWTLDEQLFLAMQRIFTLKDREAFILAGDMNEPVLIRTPDVHRPDICRVVVDLAVGWYQQESGLTLPFDQAVQTVLERDREQDGVSALVEADADFARSCEAMTVTVPRLAERKQQGTV